MKYTFENYKPSTIKTKHLNLGGSNPQGETIEVTSLYLKRNGRPWIGVMGEYHFQRDHKENWYTELCKMKAGGVSIVATYFFWIYNEEIEGQFDFTGDNDARYFLEQTRKAGLDVVLRLGPWAHGECRNGGFPDWVVAKDYQPRTNDPAYLKDVKAYWEKIYDEVKDFLFSNGGNVIGIQIENELTDNAEHIATLKEMAKEIGFDAPLWTVTGWNSETGAKIPVKEVLPLFGSYAALPWEEGTDPLPPSVHYFFTGMRNDTAIGTDLIPKTAADDGWILPYADYPYATCETGSGICPTHHRRPIMTAMDDYAMSLVKLGDGNNLIGYYMYHGGTNKIGKNSTFNESRATGYPNDYPILSYDFQAPISEYGEIREHYRLYNLLHMFVADFGDLLAPMESVLGTEKPDRFDTKALRYAMRTDGKSGFVFINHHQKNAQIEDIHDVEIDTGKLVFPKFDVCGDIAFILPYQIPLNEKTVLEYATAQLLCKTEDTYYFFEIPGIKPVFSVNGKIYDEETTESLNNLAQESREKSFEVPIEGATVKIVLLTYQQARFARKLNGKLYIEPGKDLIVFENQIRPAEPEKLLPQAKLQMFRCKEPFEPKYPEELAIDGVRALKWWKLSVDSPIGFVEILEFCDTAQIYADGELLADEFYFGQPWRVKASLLFGKECYLVTSEIKDDFYREFLTEELDGRISG